MIVYLLISLLLVQPLFNKAGYEQAPLSYDTNVQYLIIKIDDIGGPLDQWGWFLQYAINTQFSLDIGVIGALLENNTDVQPFIDKLIEKSNIGIFNHGWDHKIPEFGNRTEDYMIEHLIKWDRFMYEEFNFITKILGAPGNDIGNASDENQLIYSAMNLTGYEGLFFSKVTGSANDGAIGLDLQYFPTETFVRGFQKLKLENIISNLKKLEDYPIIFTQIHPQLGNWTEEMLNQYIETFYSETGRRGINTEDYYNTIFLENHPDYIMRNIIGKPHLESKDRDNIQTNQNVIYKEQLIIIGIRLVTLYFILTKRKNYLNYEATSGNLSMRKRKITYN